MYRHTYRGTEWHSMYRINSKSVTTRDRVTVLPISGNIQEVVNNEQAIVLVLKDKYIRWLELIVCSL